MEHCPAHSERTFPRVTVDAITRPTGNPVSREFLGTLDPPRDLKLQPWEVEVVVAHGPCPDGAAAAYVAYLYDRLCHPYGGSRLEFIFLTHHRLPSLGPRIAGKAVLFLDICPPAASLKEWNLQRYAVIDHHKTAMEDAIKIDNGQNMKFDMRRSGCALAWSYFFPGVPLPFVLQVIEVRDLYQKSLIPDCDVIACTIDNTRCPICWYEGIADPDRLKEVGEPIDRERKAAVAEYVSKARPIRFMCTSPENTPGGPMMVQRIAWGWIVEVTRPECISDTGHALLEKKHDFEEEEQRRVNGIAFMYRRVEGRDGEPPRCFVSLRSADTGPDVTQILPKGVCAGGHAHAAGFDFPMSDMPRFAPMFGGPLTFA